MRNWIMYFITLLFTTYVQAGATESQLLRISTTLPFGNPTTDSLQVLAEGIDAIPNLKAHVYANSELGGNEFVMRALQYGTIEIGVISSSVIAQKVPRLSLLSLPYLFRDQEHLKDVLRDPDFHQIIQKDVEEAGYHLLYWAVAGERSVMNNIRPIYSLEDMQGLNIRIQKAPISMQLFRALGAKPTPLDQSVVYQYLETRAIDGWENSPTTLYTLALYPVTRFVSYTRHFVIPDIVVISKTTYQRLSQAQQQALDDAAKKAQAFQWREWQERERVMVAELIHQGVTFNDVRDISEFSKVSEYLRDGYRSQFGDSLLDLVQGLRGGDNE